jgi:hypothetical protein
MQVERDKQWTRLREKPHRGCKRRGAWFEGLRLGVTRNFPSVGCEFGMLFPAQGGRFEWNAMEFLIN